MTDSAAMLRSLVVERLMPHSPDKIWRALTQPALLADWLMDNDFQPVSGHRFNFRTTPRPHWDGVVTCEVLEIEPQRRLVYRWAAAGGLDTIVTWTLATAPGGTMVRMKQTGFGPDDTNNYRGAQYGWQGHFDGLERVTARLES